MAKPTVPDEIFFLARSLVDKAIAELTDAKQELDRIVDEEPVSITYVGNDLMSGIKYATDAQTALSRALMADPNQALQPPGEILNVTQRRPAQQPITPLPPK